MIEEEWRMIVRSFGLYIKIFIFGYYICYESKIILGVSFCFFVKIEFFIFLERDN